jgi:hypothetical protein
LSARARRAAARYAFAGFKLDFARPLVELLPGYESHRLGRALLALVELQRLVQRQGRLALGADLDLAFDQADDFVLRPRAALNISLAGSSSAKRSDPFSPFTKLPSASLTSRREPAPVFSWSPAFSSIPGASGTRCPPRSTHAGICTPSTIAAAAAGACVAASASAAARIPPHAVFT